MKTPKYNALGRISRVALLDSAFKKAKPGTEYGIYTNTYLEKKGIIDFFIAKGIVVSVYFKEHFMYKIRAGRSGVIKDLLEFIPLPASERSVLDDWMQDYILITDNVNDAENFDLGFGRIYSQTSNRGYFQLLDTEINIIQLNEPFGANLSLDYICSGGNLQCGYHEGDDYVILGSEKHCEASPEIIARDFNVKPENVWRCKLPEESKLNDEFYHLDLYLTIVGKVRIAGELQEVVFKAKAYGDGATIVQKDLDQMFNPFFAAHTFLCPIELPLIIIPDNGGDYKMYSYNNCLVENYMDGENRIVNLYFPNYSNLIKKFADKVFASGNAFLQYNFSSAIEQTKKQLKNKNPWILPAAELLPLDNLDDLNVLDNLDDWDSADAIEKVYINIDEVVELCQKKIKKMVQLYAFSEIRFIDFDFRKLADRKAGLHCITKVTERDQVTLY